MALLQTVGLLAVTASVGMALLWWRQRARNRADYVDVAWAFGVGVAAAVLVARAAPPDTGWRSWIIGAVILGWSVRLGTLLLIRVRSLPEDGRYEAMKQAWGDRAWGRMFWFFQAQAVWVVMFAIPPMLAARRGGPLDGWDLVGVAIAILALLGEGIADAQLHRFRRSGDRGSVCDVGLWRWSRHPNYFFEWLHWWSYVAFAFGSEGWWLTLLGPATMLLFLFRVTGIPWTERQALASRGDAYRAYQMRTSVFFPWCRRPDPGEAS